MKHYNLRTRLFMIISILILLAVLAVSIATGTYYGKQLRRQTVYQTQQLIDQVAINTGNYVSELSRLCMSPYYSERVMKLLESEPVTDAEFLAKQRGIEGFLREMMTIPRKDILSVNIITDHIYSVSRVGHQASYLNNYQESSWYSEAMAQQSPLFIHAYKEKYGSIPYTIFSMVLRLQSLSDSRNTLGLIRVDANYSGIADILDAVELPEQGSLYLLERDGQILYSRSDKPSTLELETLANFDELFSDTDHIALNGQRYILNSSHVNETNWSVIALNPEAVVLRSVYSARRIAITAAFLCIVVGLIVTAFFVNSFLHPIHKMVETMQTAQAGDLTVRAPDSRANEISYLSSSFNNMLQEITDQTDRNVQLSREMYEAKYLKKKAQYDALYHQIRPHFLFNTLSTISLLIKSGEKDEAVKSVEDLSILLRGMVNSNKDISLASELKIVESYLHLQARRHDSLHYEISAPQEILNASLPSLSIQPIVENALVHGCEPQNSDMSILVKAELKGSVISITVEDNGIGMSKEQLASITESISGKITDPQPSTSRSIGLQNIAQRIRLRFGDSYGLSISSEENKGTAVTLIIPYSPVPQEVNI